MSGKVLGDTLFGATPPEVLVGSKLWPNVTLGPLVPPVSGQEAEKHSNPEFLYGKSIDEIIALRAQLVRSVFRLNVREARRPNRLLELTRELNISSKPVDTEVKFRKPPKPVLKFDGILAPVGPSGHVSDLEVVGNPVVPKEVESLLSDYDVRTPVAMKELYDAGTPTYYISRLLSIGVLGRTVDRLLVPSRWAITATDASISSYLRGKIQDCDELSEIQLFTETYAGNHYEILLLPSALSYEFVEVWLPESVWTPGAKGIFIGSDGEDWRGKTTFSELGGGYYAMKLPIYEYLHRIKRQAFAFALREVTPEYWAPLGSWKIREALRSAFKTPPKRFKAVEEALKDLTSRIKTPFEEWFRWAKHLRSYLTQMRLEDFLKKIK